MIKSGIIGLVVALSLLGTSAAQSTAPTGTIQGSVVDSSGVIIAGVRITAVQEDSGNSRTTETDATGHFHFGRSCDRSILLARRAARVFDGVGRSVSFVGRANHSSPH